MCVHTHEHTFKISTMDKHTDDQLNASLRKTQQQQQQQQSYPSRMMWSKTKCETLVNKTTHYKHGERHTYEFTQSTTMFFHRFRVPTILTMQVFLGFFCRAWCNSEITEDKGQPVSDRTCHPSIHAYSQMGTITPTRCTAGELVIMTMQKLIPSALPKWKSRNKTQRGDSNRLFPVRAPTQGKKRFPLSISTGGCRSYTS